MSSTQKIAAHVRKVSQLSSALGVSNVKNVSNSAPYGFQEYQVLHTTEIAKQDVKMIGETKKINSCIEGKEQTQDEGHWKQLHQDWGCHPLPSKRWEKEISEKPGWGLDIIENKKK